MRSLKQMWSAFALGCALLLAAPFALASGRDHRGGYEDRGYDRSGYGDSGYSRRPGRNSYDDGHGRHERDHYRGHDRGYRYGGRNWRRGRDHGHRHHDHHRDHYRHY